MFVLVKHIITMPDKKIIAPETGEFLKRLIAITAFSTEELADMAGLNRTTVIRKISGESNMKVEAWITLIKNLKGKLPRQIYKRLIEELFLK